MARIALPVRNSSRIGTDELTPPAAGLLLVLAAVLFVTPFVPASAVEAPKPEATTSAPSAQPQAQPPAPSAEEPEASQAPAPKPPPDSSPPASTPPISPPVTRPASGNEPSEPTVPASESEPDTESSPASVPAGTPASGAPAAAAQAAVPSDRGAAYLQFREHFGGGRFAEALPAAEQVVKLTETRYGADSAELIMPLVNVGTTQMRLNNFYGAETAYRRALRIAEARSGGYSREVIQPLHGLGLAYLAGGQLDNAAESLRRAVDVSRKLDGLFNIQQLPLVESLVDSYVALQKTADVDREQQYALRLSENTFGKNDPRMVPVLDRNAAWCETTGRYRMARQAYARSLEILGRSAGKRDPAVVAPLRGIARTYRLEYLYGTQEADPEGSQFNPALSGQIGAVQQAVDGRTLRLDGDGEAALQLALSVLEDRPDQTGLRAETLLDLGDWYQLSAKPYQALRVYKEAWTEFSSPNGPGVSAMNQPAQLYYRPPTAANKRTDKDEDEMTESFVEMEFTVSPEGRVVDARIVSSDASESQEKSVQIALRRARYRPRFVDGAPVATKGLRHRQVLYALNPGNGRSSPST